MELAVGMIVGSDVGTIVGSVVGVVGEKVGTNVGLVVGMIVGVVVGVVGTIVGLAVGVVGAKVGLTVGVVGMTVGSAEGSSTMGTIGTAEKRRVPPATRYSPKPSPKNVTLENVLVASMAPIKLVYHPPVETPGLSKYESALAGSVKAPPSKDIHRPEPVVGTLYASTTTAGRLFS